LPKFASKISQAELPYLVIAGNGRYLQPSAISLREAEGGT